MRSIDNLREYALTAPAASMGSMARAIVAGKADDIEREVEELTDERDLLKTQWKAAVDFAQRLESCADNREDVTLFGVDYTPLPVDADGVPIHVGDVMEWSDGSTCEVVGIGNGGTLYYMDELEGTVGWTNAEGKRHHHAPTVEDVLREFGAGWYERMSGPETFDIADYVEHFAAKLRLAEGVDA